MIWLAAVIFTVMLYIMNEQYKEEIRLKLEASQTRHDSKIQLARTFHNLNVKIKPEEVKKMKMHKLVDEVTSRW